MANPLITTVLSRAGDRILEALIERAQEYDEATDRAVYTIIEHWCYELQDSTNLAAAFDAAQDLFHAQVSSGMSHLDALADLLRHGGAEGDAFARNLWLAHFFRLETAADELWTQYSELHRTALIETGRSLARSWGEWILPMQEFMNRAESLLVDQNELFERLFTSEDVLDLLERLFEPAGVAHDREPTDMCPPTEPLNAVATLSIYLNACAEQVGHISPRGYTIGGRKTVPISDVYVPLTLVPLVSVGKPGRYTRYQTATYDHPELYNLHYPLDHKGMYAQEGKPVTEVLGQYPQLLILGEVGAGKTTLLRHLAYEHARVLMDDQNKGIEIESRPDGSFRLRLVRRLPIYLDLADYAEQRHEDEDLMAYLLRAAAGLVEDANIEALLKQFLETGQCLILLDGLDHVVSDDQRRLVLTNVVRASAGWRAHGNQVVVTSRLEAFDTSPLPAEFAGYVIRGLDRGQINTLILKWKMTLARVERPLIGDEEAIRKAQSEMLSLIREIAREPRLRLMASSPLTLRLLVEVYRHGMVIQPSRAAIFQMTAEMMIREWRLPHRAGGRPAVIGQEAENLLSELAFWLQSARPSGTLTERELYQILGNIWHQMHPDMSASDVETAIGDFIGSLRMHPALLIELSPQRYGFAYQGLQEYFAARHMVASYRQAPERIRQRLHDPRWDEVIRFAIGLTALHSREDASDLVETAVLARGPRAAQLGFSPSPFEEWLKRDLFFAARLLGDDIELSAELVQTIVEDLMMIWLDGDRSSLGRFSLVFDTARRHLVNLDGTSASRRAMQIGIQSLRVGDDHQRAYAVDALTFWESRSAEARDHLIQIGREAPPLVRLAMAQALGYVGELSREAYVLLLVLASDADERVSKLSQQTLEQAAPVPYEALSTWVKYLSSSDNVRRRLGLHMLEQVGALPPMVIGELLNLIDDPDPTIRQRALDVLGGVPNLPNDALSALCRMISDDDPKVRIAAIGALARPVTLPLEVIEQLVRWSSDRDVGVRRAAVGALGRCLNTQAMILEALVERLDDPVDSIREAVIEPLVRKGKENLRIRHLLAHVVRDPIYSVRRAVAAALHHFERPDADVRHLLETLLNDREIIVRETTLETIAHIKEPGHEIISYLIGLVEVPSSPIAGRALRALVSLRDLPEQALVAIVENLPSYWEIAQQEIKRCLKDHMPLGPEIVSHLIELAGVDGLSAGADRSPAGLRALILEVLGYVIEDSAAIMQFLLETAASETDVELRSVALRALANSGAMTPTLRRVLLHSMNQGESIHVRAAAGCALGRLIYRLPDHTFDEQEVLKVAHGLASLLKEIQPRASWELGTELQNEVYVALQQVVSRARPTRPRLAARSENPAGDLDQESGDRHSADQYASRSTARL